MKSDIPSFSKCERELNRTLLSPYVICARHWNIGTANVAYKFREAASLARGWAARSEERKVDLGRRILAVSPVQRRLRLAARGREPRSRDRIQNSRHVCAQRGASPRSPLREEVTAYFYVYLRSYRKGKGSGRKLGSKLRKRGGKEEIVSEC